MKVGSVNVNGIRNRLKRKSLFRLLKKQNYDIICLQETGIADCDKLAWEREWGGQIIHVSGSNHSKGQVILFKNDFPYQIDIVTKVERILIVSIEIDGNKTNIVNIYAPNKSNEKHAFYTNLQTLLIQLDGEIIACGDFNCVLDNELDIVNGGPHRPADVEMFNNMVSSCALSDEWRLSNPTEMNFSWSRNNPLTARRLDYIFVSEFIFNKTIESNIISILTVHRP